MTSPPDRARPAVLRWVAAALLACASVAPASGQQTNYTWTGASNNLWFEPSNWNPTGVPGVANVYVTFDNAGNGHTAIDLGGGITNLQMTFNPGAAAYTLGTPGQSMTLAGQDYYPRITVSAGVTNDQTIAADIHFFQGHYVPAQVAFSNNSAAALTFSGATIAGAGGDPGDASVLYLGGNGNGVSTISSYLNFPLSGPNVGITKQGTGTWQLLNPTNTLLGGMIWIQQGTLVVTSLRNMEQTSSIGVMTGGANTNFWMAGQGDATLRYVGASSSTDWDWAIGVIDGDTNPHSTATFDIVGGTALAMNGNQKNERTSAVGILQKTGAGTLALNGTNEYQGATIISEGVLSVMTVANGGHASGLGASSSAAGNLVFDGGTLQYANTLTSGSTDRSFTIADGQTAGFDVIGQLQVAGSTGPTTGGIRVTGGGTLILSGNNIYTGPTVVSGATLVASTASTPFGGSSLGFRSDVDLTASGVLDLTNITSNIEIGSLSGQSGSTVVFHALVPPFDVATLTINSSANATFGGAILQGGGITKLGYGTQTLTGTNYFNGPTVVQGGTLAVSGASGTINGSSAIAISGSATLAVENFGAATATDRIWDGATITMGGGTLSFRNDADTPDFAETLGALTLTAGGNTIENGGAAPGKTSALTFASLTRTGSATVNFSGTGLGLSDRNRIFFTAAPTLGGWAIYNGTGYATYDATNGVVEALYVDVTRLSSGEKIIYNAPDGNIRIIDGTGTPEPVTLGGGGSPPPSPPPPEPSNSLTAIHGLVQSATGGPVTITISNNQIFQVESVLVGSNAGALTLGATPGVGKISSSYAALTVELRPFRLINNSTNLLTVNSTVTDAWIDGGWMEIALEKSGAGTVVLAASNTYYGTTTIGQGVLSVSSINDGFQSGGLGQASGSAGNIVFDGGTLLYTGTNASTDRGFTVKSGGSRLESSADLHFNGSNGIVLTAGDLTVGGAGHTTISTVISGAGALAKDGASTLTLQGANTFTGGVTIRGGAVSVTNIGNGGQAGNLGAALNASTNLVLDGGALVYSSTGISGSDRGMTVTANGGTFVNANTDANFFLANGSPVAIARSGVFAVDGSGNTVIGNVVSGAGALRKTGDGMLLLENPGNAFTGGVTISGGALDVMGVSNGGQAGYLGAASADPANLVFDGGTLSLSSGTVQSTDRGFTITAGKTATIQVTNSTSLTISGDVPTTTGALAKTGDGTLTLSGDLAFTGAATVSAGRLNIDGSLGPGAVPGDTVYVAAGATLGGSGTIRRDVYVTGTHSPGSSPGLQTIDGAVVYNPGATVVWELAASTTAGRGTNYDGINGSGHVANFLGSTALDLVFNAPGSTVKWRDGLWDTNRQWVVYSNFSTIGFQNLALDSDWLDSDGALFSTLLPDSTFSIAQSGNDIVLNYTGVPEPSTWALLALTAAGLVAHTLRRRS